jgi:hypothetical protein
MTPSVPDVARSFTRALTACHRRRLPADSGRGGPARADPSVAFTRGTPPIRTSTSRPPNGSSRASSRHAHAR